MICHPVSTASQTLCSFINAPVSSSLFLRVEYDNFTFFFFGVCLNFETYRGTNLPKVDLVLIRVTWNQPPLLHPAKKDTR